MRGGPQRLGNGCRGLQVQCTILHHTPCTHTPYTMHHTLYTMHHTLCTIHSYTMHYAPCSGRYLVNVSLVDKLVVPPTTPAGAYVLQLRYDCEETAQV
jgi:hypothetical protein